MVTDGTELGGIESFAVIGRADGIEVGARLFKFEGSKVGLEEGTAVDPLLGINDGPEVGV